MRFGLLGTGPWAQLAHAPGLAAHAGAELTGVWGRDPAKAAALAARYGARPYPDVDALLADVDAVAVALPPDVQEPLARRAARAGRHLLLDKPVALDPAAAAELAAATAEAGVASVVFFTGRFDPAVAGFLERAAATGGWTAARVEHLGSIHTPGNPFGASPWRREHGGLWDVGPHALALVLPVLGPVAAVTALAGPRGTTHALLRHAGGAVSSLTLSVDAPVAAARQEAVFSGEPGTAAVPDDDDDVLAAFGRAVDALLTAAAGGPPSAVDVRFGADVVRVLAAVAASVRTGRTVEP